MNSDAIYTRLIPYQDSAYKEFHASVARDIDPACILGVRMPVLRSLGKKLSQEEKEFLLNYPDPAWYEEIVLKVLLVNEEKDFDRLLTELEGLRPVLSSWALTDLIAPAAVKKCSPEQKEILFERIQLWLHSPEIYTRRMALVLLLKFYLDPVYAPGTSQSLLSLDCSEEMVSKACAWLVCEGLIKAPEFFWPLLQQFQLDDLTHNRAIQKGIDSFRIGQEDKKRLSLLRRKKGKKKSFSV